MADVLKDLKREAAKLKERSGALGDELARMTAREAEALLVLDRMKAGLVSGTATVEGVQRAERDAAETAAVRRHLAEAHDAVQADLGRAETAIEGEERRREAERQEAVAAPLRAEADAELRRWAEAVVGLHDPLRRRREIAERLARDFPNVPGIEALNFDILGAVLRAVWTRGANGPEFQTRYAMFARTLLDREPVEPRAWTPRVSEEVGIKP